MESKRHELRKMLLQLSHISFVTGIHCYKEAKEKERHGRKQILAKIKEVEFLMNTKNV